MEIYLLILLAMICLLLFGLIIIFIIQNNKIQKTLNNFNNDAKNSIDEHLNNYSLKELERINKLDKELKELWYQNDLTSHNLINNVNKEVIKVYEHQKELKELSKHILEIESLLNDKKTRGIFGETRLYHLLDIVYPKGEMYQKQIKLSNGYIADAGIKYKDVYLIIDAKFPLENYNRLYSKAGLDQNYKSAFKKDIIKHINDISFKYLIKNETSEVALMFVPSETVFSAINNDFSELIEYAYQKSVYLCSPSSLIAYLNLINNFYLDYQKNNHLKLIQTEYIKLETEFKRYNERFDLLKKDFDKISKDFYDITITSNKLVKRFEAIGKLDLKRYEDE